MNKRYIETCDTGIMNSMLLNSKKQQIGFTSDMHMWHRNVIKYSNRPFQTAMEMNEAIRDRHNQTFDKDAIIFNLGDALLIPRLPNSRITDPVLLKQAEEFLQTFNGNIFYLPGNHEHQLDSIKKHWKVLPQLYEINVLDDDAMRGKQTIVMCHYALRNWNKAHYGSWNLFGHSHGALTSDTGENMEDYDYSLSMDVGVDTNDYYPYEYADIKRHMKTKLFKPIDHHSPREE